MALGAAHRPVCNVSLSSLLRGVPVAKGLAQGQVLSSFWSWLLLALWFGSSSKIPSLSGCRRQMLGGFPLSPYCVPLPCPSGFPDRWSLFPARMLCEVSSMESWGFQQVFEHMLWQILL